MIMIQKVIDKQLGRLISTIEHYNFPGCPQSCGRDYWPVCGTDGKTYNTKCHLEVEACNTGNTDLAVTSKGVCAGYPFPAGITLHHQHIDLRSGY